MSCNVVDITDYDPVNLLTQNEVYLNAVQKASISVYNLGFKPLVQNTIHRRDGLLTAVVPRLDQAPFLDRVDASVHTYIRQKRKQDQTSRMRCSMDPNSEVMKNLAQFQLQHGVENPDEDNDDGSKKRSKKNSKKVLKVNPNEEIRAARPTARMEKEKEEKRKKEEEEKKKEVHKQKIAKRFVLIEDGEEMVYDDNGNKVPLQVYEKYKLDKQKEAEKKAKREAEELAKARKEALAKAYSSQKELWMKSSSRVERLRQQAITQRKEYPYWSPGALPASTITMAKEQSVLPALLVFQKFPRTGEYDAAVHSMMPGDILVTIEHCDHCHHHEDYTHHQTLQYEEMSKAVIEALKETAQRYALRFFSIIRGIDEIDALQLSRAHANMSAKQLEASRTHESLHHTSSLLSLGMGQSALAGAANNGKNVDMRDEIAKEDRAIEQTLGKLRRSMSFRSFKLATDDAQAIRNEAKVQVLQTHNKHRIGAFEVQVTLCINPSATQSHRHDNSHNHRNDSNLRPSTAPPTSNRTGPNMNNGDGTQQQEQVLSDQPRRLIQHVLYSKLFHGAWPSIMKLRERLEVLLDTHEIARIVSGSTVRSSFNASLSNKRPQSAPTSNPVLLGPLSQIQLHHEQNARKVIEQQQSLRRRNSSRNALPLELLDPEAELMRRAQQDSLEASAWQERELRRVTPLEDIVPPIFDNRFVEVQVKPKSPTAAPANANANNSPNNMKRSISNSNLRKNSNSTIGKASPGMNSKGASSPSKTTPLISPSLQTKQPFSETKLKETAGIDSKKTAANSHSQNQMSSSGPLSIDDFKDVSLSEDEMLQMEDEILKSTRAAEKKKHDWSEPEDEHNKEFTIIEETDAQVNAASSKRTSLVEAPATSSFSSPNPIVKLKTKSVSFYGDTEKTAPNPNDASPLIPEGIPVVAVLSPEDFSPIPKSYSEKKNLPVPSNPRPTMIMKKPSLRTQPSLKKIQVDDDGSTDSPAETEVVPDSSPAGDGSNKNNQSQSSLTDHFKSKGSSDMLKEALLSIQRMLSKDDDDDDDDDDHHHYHHDDSHGGYQLMRSDTFADDPFFKQLEQGEESMSMLRISVNLGDDHSVLLDSHEEHEFDPVTAAATAVNRLRGGVQVAVTEVPRES